MRSRRVVRSLLLGPAFAALAALAACGDDATEASSSGATTGDPPCAGSTCACEAPFAPHPSGEGCIEVAAPGACPPGTRPAIGEATCVAAGWTACADGFVLDPTGWACIPVLPPEPCVAPFIDALGSTSCAPIGDCGAAFPPPDATHFVDDDFADGDLDDTHFASISAALLAAPSGAVIAVDEGTYVESLAIDRPVTVLGRCADLVLVVSDGGGAAGVQSEGPTARVAGLTLDGHRGGVVAVGATVTVERCAIVRSRAGGVVSIGADLRLLETLVHGTDAEDGTLGVGAFAQSQGELTIERSAFVRNRLVGVLLLDGGVARVSRSVFRETLPIPGGTGSEDRGTAIGAFEGARLEVEASAFVDGRAAHIELGDPGTTALVERSSLLRSHANDAGLFGNGIELGTGAALEVRETAIVEADGFAVMAIDPGTSMALRDVVATVAAEHPRPGAGFAVFAGATATIEGFATVGLASAGIVSQDPGTTLDLRRGLISDMRRTAQSLPGDGIGLGVTFGARATVDDVTVVRPLIAGVAIGGREEGAPSEAHLNRVLVVDPRADEAGFAGRGLEITGGGVVRIDASALVAGRDAALSAGDGAILDAARVSIRGTTGAADGRFGHGVLVGPGATARLSTVWTREHHGSGVVFAAATGLLDACVVADNTIGLNAQDGTTIVEGEPAEPAPLELLVTPTTRFARNVTRVGSTALPLPGSIE